MAQYGYSQGPSYGQQPAQNLQFYSSSFTNQPVSGHSTPFQAGYGAPAASSYPTQYGAGFNAPGVSGQMGVGASGLRTGWLAAFGTEGYEGEPPLLEELGVNFGHIKMKTLAVLNPFGRIDQHIMDDSDVAGPVLFFFVFGTSLLLSGKLHFGYIYGGWTLFPFRECPRGGRKAGLEADAWPSFIPLDSHFHSDNTSYTDRHLSGLAVLGTLLLHTIISLMSPPLSPGDMQPDAHGHPPPHGSSHFSSTLTYPRSASVLGYCLLPLVLVAILGIVVPLDGFFGYLLTSLAIVWCAYSSSSMFTTVGELYPFPSLSSFYSERKKRGCGRGEKLMRMCTGRMTSMRGLVAYPMVLFYGSFGIMAIFSSRGTGNLAKVATPAAA